MQLQNRYDEIRSLGAEIIAVSMDDLRNAGKIVERTGIEFPILFTEGEPGVPMAYDVFNVHRDNLAAPAVFIIGRDGQLHWKFLDRTNYAVRPPARTVINELAKIVDVS